ncbi:MAG TPA: DUF1007 family protein [Hyphomicrobiaceae bacterium]|jgi:ABC-type uncharacterized transport system substrate-binding protein|nr:DUF1007 family protein [Hyphomicrobiaceae bacterium]
MPRLSASVIGLIAGLAMLGGVRVGPAAAHPHVWITVETTLMYDKGAFTGLRHKWTFDQYYTAMAIEGLDKNKDGKYDREELAELAKVNIDGLKEFAYFTTASVAGREIKFEVPSDYWLEHRDGVLALNFTLPFVEPVSTEAKGLTFAVQDPTFFIAFDLAKVDPARLGPGTPAACKIKVGSAREQAGALGDAFAKQFGAFALGGSQAISVDCQGP